MVGVHTRHHNAMGDAAREKTSKCRKREGKEGEGSAVADGPQVKKEPTSEAEEREGADGESTVKLRDNTEDKRKAEKQCQKEIRNESRPCIKAANLAREGTGRTFEATVPDRDASEPSSSYSSYSSVGSWPRGRSYGSESSGQYYEPPHPWSDDGGERLHEAVAREKKERRRVKDRSRARSRSRGHAKRSKESHARPARSDTPPEDQIFNKYMVKLYEPVAWIDIVQPCAKKPRTHSTAPKLLALI